MDKLKPRAIKYVFAGYSRTQKGYRCFHTVQHKFYAYANVLSQFHILLIAPPMPQPMPCSENLKKEIVSKSKHVYTKRFKDVVSTSLLANPESIIVAHDPPRSAYVPTDSPLLTVEMTLNVEQEREKKKEESEIKV